MGVSLCMANISGVVTDTGSTPISGAVVQLEKGGQTAISGADGSFTLGATTGTLPGQWQAVAERSVCGNNREFYKRDDCGTVCRGDCDV